MKIIAPELDMDLFWFQLREVAIPLLILDYDGTLAPFQIDPADAVPYPQIPPVLNDLMGQSRTRVIIVSGRPAIDVRKLLDLQEPPEIWGCHGAERLTRQGVGQSASLPNVTARALKTARQQMEESNFGGRIEIKPFSMAVHWRGLENSQEKYARMTAQRILTAYTGQTGLSLTEFDGGLELRPEHITKAHAIKTILSEAPQPSACAYLGDDHTDEDAFAALSGKGLSVLVRTDFRPTLAQLWLKPPEDLIEFLHTWLDFTSS